MNKLWLLTKTELINLLTNSTFRMSSKRKKAIGYLALILPAALITYIFGVYSVAMFSEVPAELAPMLFILMVFACFALLIFLSFYGAYGHLFGFKDYDLLMSLPIKKSSIMASKLIAFVLTDYFYEFFMLVPLVVVYNMYYPQNIMFFVYAFIVFIFFPFIPITIASLASFLLNLFSRNSKYSGLFRNIFMVILMVGLIVAIMGMQMVVVSDVTYLTDIVSNFKNYLFVVYYPAVGILEQNIGYIAITLLLNIGAFVIFILLANKLYVKLNGNLSVGYKVKNFKLTETRQSSITMALFKREVKRYFSSVTYFINTFFGPFMLLAGVIYLAFNKSQLSMLPVELSGDSLIPFAAIALLTTTLLTTTTSCSISLEGDRLWILKSLPIPVEKMFWSKVLLNLMVEVPMTILAILAFGIFFNISMLGILFLIVLEIVYAVLNSFLGLVINLYFPKLEWDRDVVVIKNSMSVLISIFLGMGLTAIIGLIGLNLPSSISLFMYAILLLVLGIVISGGLWIFLKTKGTKLFQKLY